MPSNPLTMRGRLARCWLFAYQTPVAAARRLLPAELEPVTFGGRAFWSVVVCRIQGMRPKGAPAFLGIDYWHVAYRLYARFTAADGRSWEGLYFLRSDCDSGLISTVGNRLTDFRFHTAEIRYRENGESVTLEVAGTGAPGKAVLHRDRAPRLPEGSAFGALEEAAARLKYGPAGFSVSEPGWVDVLSITRDEAAWKSRLVHVESESWSYLETQSAQLEVCCELEPIEYQWNRGVRVRAASPSANNPHCRVMIPSNFSPEETAQINAALVQCVSSSLSREAEAEITRRFGAGTAAQVRAVYDAAMNCPVDWRTANMDTALDALHAFLREQYPWLSDEARTRLNYCYIMCWK